MANERLTQAYFDWMCHLVSEPRRFGRPSRKKLLGHLHEHPFQWVPVMDRNRADDGMELRYRFACDNGYPWPAVAAAFGRDPCSVLEMMVALAIRCEEHIMGDPDIGNRTGEWFWGMVNSLGLGRMNDANDDPYAVTQAVLRLAEQDYEPNGRGGLFTVSRYNVDLRTVEIWYQMMWYLDEYMGR